MRWPFKKTFEERKLDYLYDKITDLLSKYGGKRDKIDQEDHEECKKYYRRLNKIDPNSERLETVKTGLILLLQDFMGGFKTIQYDKV